MPTNADEKTIKIMKMKHYGLMFLMLAAVLMATGCDDGFADEPISEVENALTVEEAEAYFE